MNWSELNGAPLSHSRLDFTSGPGPGPPPPPPFDTSVITEVFPPIREGSRLTLEWTSSAPPGTWFQIYIQGELAWWGTDLFATVTAPLGLIDVQIGAVADGDQTTDFSGDGFDVLGFDAGGYSGGLAVTPITTRALLTWSGFGAVGYHVYAGGAGFDHGGFDLGGYNGSAGSLVGNVVAFEGGLSTDGFDLGGYSAGGFDVMGGDYVWTSQPLTRGVWNFAVMPYDAAGAPGTGETISVLITAPPKPPAPNPSGSRLTHTYNATTHAVTLFWLASLG